jgi:phage-related protein
MAGLAQSGGFEVADRDLKCQVRWASLCPYVFHDSRSPSEKRRGDSAATTSSIRSSRTQAIYYRDKRGIEPVNQFIEALPAKSAVKIDDYIEEYLNGRAPDAPPPEFPVSSQVEGGLRELRVRFAHTRYRILYQRSENLIVLLHAFEKNTGSVPASETALAKRRMADFKRRMDSEPPRPPRAAGKDAPSTRR